MASNGSNGKTSNDYRVGTLLGTAGRDPFAHHGYVNPPVYHASTLLHKNVASYLSPPGHYRYARRGTPTSEALADALRTIEGPQCAGVALLPSGLAAASVALLSAVEAGDHVLVTDSVYGPTRKFCDTVLARCGVATSYYPPAIGAGIAALMKPQTRAVFLESPGSLSFEIQDVPAIAAAAHARGATVLMDNTWATAVYLRALEMGVDLAIQSGTKYIGGHADVMFGAVAANSKAWPQLRATVYDSGLCMGPDDMFLALRGLRTLAVRLSCHQASAMTVARFLEARPEVAQVLYPALESHPGHAIWKRDFAGASGLFSVVFKPAPRAAVHAFIDALALFGIGDSWGGYESLAIPFDCTPIRTAVPWSPGGPTVRFHVGLEDVSDLIGDLERGFTAFAAALNS
jgi:cysteine-S-conjugate beta-lyase